MTPDEVKESYGKKIKILFPCRGDPILVKITDFNLNEKTAWGRGWVKMEYAVKRTNSSNKITWAINQLENVSIVDSNPRTRKRNNNHDGNNRKQSSNQQSKNSGTTETKNVSGNRKRKRKNK